MCACVYIYIYIYVYIYIYIYIIHTCIYIHSGLHSPAVVHILRDASANVEGEKVKNSPSSARVQTNRGHGNRATRHPLGITKE